MEMENHQSERWLPVIGFEKFYEVSDRGHVRSLDRPHPLVNGKFGVRRSKVLKPALTSKGGYSRVVLRRDRKSYPRSVHALVLEAFIGPRPEGMFACHGNDVGSDNRLENLRWDTPGANSREWTRRRGSGVPRNRANQDVIQGEQWLPTIGFQGFYEVSDRGRVKSLPGSRRRGRSSQQRIMNPFSTGGYQQIRLFGDNKRENTYVHILVLEAFVGPRPDGMYGCHNDGDPTNNRLNNLRWDTPSRNNHDTVKHGTHHNARKAHCVHSHLLDADRTCHECRRIRGRARRAAKEACPQGHLFDGVKLNADGSVRQRFCTICVKDQLDRGRRNRKAA